MHALRRRLLLLLAQRQIYTENARYNAVSCWCSDLIRRTVQESILFESSDLVDYDDAHTVAAQLGAHALVFTSAKTAQGTVEDHTVYHCPVPDDFGYGEQWLDQTLLRLGEETRLSVALCLVEVPCLLYEGVLKSVRSQSCVVAADLLRWLFAECCQ